MKLISAPLLIICLALASCTSTGEQENVSDVGSSTPAAASSDPSTTASASDSLPSPTASPSSEAAESPTSVDAQTDASAEEITKTELSELEQMTCWRHATMLQRSWNRAVHSAGREDHRETLEEFIEDIDDRIDDNPECGEAKLAYLNMEATFLSSMTLVGGESPAEYEAVAEAGNDWLESIGAEDVERFGTP